MEFAPSYTDKPESDRLMEYKAGFVNLQSQLCNASGLNLTVMKTSEGA
jgi:hypothetical protein